MSFNGTRPLIGCTTYRKTADQNPPIEILGLMPSYVQAVVAAGGLPVLIPLGLQEAELLAILQRVDGVLLPGGGDIDPELYAGMNNHTTLWGIDADRDRVEVVVARQAVQQQKPLLAICRGHQLLNVALGGSLYEDVHSLAPSLVKHDNYRVRPRNYLAHDVTIAADSLLAQQLGCTETAVNSLHHQAIRDLAPALTAVATAPDGLIEAVEVHSHPFAIGVQWHPENLIEDDPAMLNLFKGFITAAAN
jgi:putative glutamine amidotransferase